MTENDLRVQKGLTMLELEEAEQANNAAQSAFSNTANELRVVADLLNRNLFRGDAALREELSKYRNLVNVDTIVAACANRDAAIRALETAQRKLAVFRA